MSVLDTLRAATPTRKAVTMCLDGALQAEWDQTLDRLDAAGKADAESLAMTETNKIVDELDALRDRMLASEVTFVFERVPWEKRIALQAEHPPREDNAADRVRGFNIEAFYPALIRASCVSVKGAEGDEATVPEEDWAALLGALNFKQINTLADAANFVNEGQNAVPPSARSLLVSQDFGASLAQPSPGTSALDDSEAGNPPGSPKSSTTKKARSKGSRTAT